jgi:hypothetical protein
MQAASSANVGVSHPAGSSGKAQGKAVVPVLPGFAAAARLGVIPNGTAKPGKKSDVGLPPSVSGKEPVAPPKDKPAASDHWNSSEFIDEFSYYKPMPPLRAASVVWAYSGQVNSSFARFKIYGYNTVALSVVGRNGSCNVGNGDEFDVPWFSLPSSLDFDVTDRFDSISGEEVLYELQQGIKTTKALVQFEIAVDNKVLFYPKVG